MKPCDFKKTPFLHLLQLQLKNQSLCLTEQT